MLWYPFDPGISPIIPWRMVPEIYEKEKKKKEIDVIINRLATKRKRYRIACVSMGYVRVKFGLQDLFVDDRNVR